MFNVYNIYILYIDPLRWALTFVSLCGPLGPGGHLLLWSSSVRVWSLCCPFLTHVAGGRGALGAAVTDPIWVGVVDTRITGI